MDNRPSIRQLVHRFERGSLNSKTSGPNISSPFHKDKRLGLVNRSLQNLAGLFKKSVSKAHANIRASGRPLSPDPDPSAEIVLHPTEIRNPSSASRTLWYLPQPDVSLAASSTLHMDSLISCRAALQNGQLVLTWPVEGGKLESKSISLVDCIDVRSLSASTFIDRRDIEESKLKLFEVYFRNGSPQRLATATVEERAAWISDIWSVVLSSLDSGRESIVTSSHENSTYGQSNKTASQTDPGALPHRSQGISLTHLDKPLSSNDNRTRTSRFSAHRRNKPLPDPDLDQERSIGRSSNYSILQAYIGGHSPALQEAGLDNNIEQSGIIDSNSLLNSINQKLDNLQQYVSSTRDRLPPQDSAFPSLVQQVEGIEVRLREKLQIVLSTLENIQRTRPEGITQDGHLPATTDKIENALSKGDESATLLPVIHEMLQDSGRLRQEQVQQQADCIRYLNELNTWLEAFVNNGTTQIQAMAESIEAICAQLGCEGGRHEGRTANSDIIMELRSLTQRIAIHEQGMNSAFPVLQSLPTLMNQTSINAEAVNALFVRQRGELEQLLHNVKAELSSEIRGEKLRFIEAMKEATAFNVNNHVEQFKNELRREIQGLTQEVGKLHRERQNVENQIADLFAFYAKQKNTTDVVADHPPVHQMAHHPQWQPVPTSSPRRRPP